MAWLSGWAKRVKLTIDQNDIDATLSNFPILVYISTSSGRNNDDISFVFDELQSDANRKRIAVTTSNGETQCYIEIEKWDDANEHAWLWVKAPSIASDADTDLYLYYDSTHADNADYVGDTNDEVAENVWDANFKGVWHLDDADGTADAIKDSTVNAFHLTKKGDAEPANADSLMGRAHSFDGVDDQDKRTAVPMTAIDNFTLETSVNLDSVLEHGYFLKVGNILAAAPYGDGYALAIGTGSPGYADVNGNKLLGILEGIAWLDPGTNIGTGWHYLVLRRASGTTKFLLDGTLLAFSSTSTPNIPTTEMVIGGQAAGAYVRYVDAIIDESRVSDINRTDAWIKATYETGRDHLLDFGNEELAPSAYYHGLKVQGIGELALCDIGTHPLRIRKGGTTYGIELVAIDDPNASALRIKTPSGIKAIRKYT